MDQPKLKMKLTREELDQIKIECPYRFDGSATDKLILHAEETVELNCTVTFSKSHDAVTVDGKAVLTGAYLRQQMGIAENPAQPTEEEMRSIVQQMNDARQQSIRLQLSANFLQQLLHGESWGDNNRVVQAVSLADELLAELERTSNNQ